MNVDLGSKTAVITGAANGIGRATALLFARNGADIVVVDLNEERGGAVAREIAALGGKSVFIKADVGNYREVAAMVDRIIAELGRIDILINNAGINLSIEERVPIFDFNNERWHKLINVDLDGVYYCSKVVSKHMVQNKAGKIINISSIAGMVPLRLQCAFTAAKAGVINLTKAMALELAPYSINANVILPGSIACEITATNMYKDGRYESIMSHIPLNRPGTPEDIGYAALYLASEAASYVTGSVLTVDGGWTCGYTREW